MASDFSAVCDALITDLTGQVAALTDAETHRYTPWSPEQLDASDAKRHLAVWPAGEEMESAQPETAGGLGGTHKFTQGYIVLVWEQAEEEASRREADEAAAATFLELHNAIRSRFYVVANQTLGGAHPLWYAGSRLPETPSRVRWMQLFLRATRYQDFTP